MSWTAKEALDVCDVAQLFKCSREKIKRMARRGELPAFKFGNRWYVLRDDLDRFVIKSRCHLRRVQEV